MPKDLNFTPGKTARDFMVSDHRLRVIMGPVGSGKTSACIMELLRQSITIPSMADGIRRSRQLITRNTRQQLVDTTLASIIGLLPESIYTWRSSDFTLRLRFNDVESDWLLRSLDTPEDVQRVLSLEISNAWVEESREIPVALLSDLDGRVGRYPSQSGGFRYHNGIICSTNPPEIDSNWYKLMEHMPQEEGNDNSIIAADTFKQPSGLSTEAENKENLRPNYYDELSRGKTAEWVSVYVHGNYAMSQAGKPVYRDSFKFDRHVSKTPLKIDPHLPVIIGQDTGRTPASVFMQMGHDGRLRVLREAPGFNIGTKAFAQMKLNPVIRNFFSSNPLIFVLDPAGVRQNETDDNSWLRELRNIYRKEDGHTVVPAVTNDPIVRINAIDESLRSWPDGEPAILIDPACKMFIEGLRSKYRYVKLKGSADKFQANADKNDWSHTVEAAQYGVLFATGKHYDATHYSRATTSKRRSIVTTRVADRYAGY